MTSHTGPSFGESYPRPIQGVEFVGFIRRTVWHNAGFGALRRIWMHIGNAEPRFVPTVYPCDVPNNNTTEVPIGNKAEERDVPALANSAVAQYRKSYLSGDVTPLDIVEALLPLIRRDISPPGIHSTAWVDIKTDLVLKAAETSTLRYRRQKSLGPLDGILVGIKDQYDVDGYSTTLGSPHDLTGRDEDGNTYNSWCVEKLQEAGAIIVGKLNMHEFGMDTAGINTTYGTPRNPYNRNYYTGGSSSGPAYAVATGLVPIALGTDGGGSIRVPASFCSVFGLKPSHGRLSYLPGHNHNSTCEVNAPIAADMGSLATVYSVVSQQPHPASPFPHAPLCDMLLPNSNHKNSEKVLLGIPEAWFDRADPGVQNPAGASSTTSSRPRNMPQSPHRLPANRILLALGRATSAGDYILAQRLRGVLMRHLAWLWREKYGSQDLLIVTPTTSCAGWPIRSLRELDRGLSDGNRTQQSMEYVWLANFCGMPSLSVPAGYVVPESEAGAGRAVRFEPGAEKAGAVVPVGLMATAEWTREDLLMRFGCDAEEVGRERLRRPAAWVDVVQQAAQRRSTRESRKA
ncbi:amidase [Apiospora hydei]|uniref:Amidase n=1 Tax=Apiospora hydei TaxID=1337664 RepID=A0ABR1V5H7_9PEZI